MAKRDLDIWRPSRRLRDLWRDPFAMTPFPHAFGTGLLDELFAPGFLDTDLNRPIMPAVDIEETEDQYLISLDMPGMRKEHIRIETSGNQLTVSAERKEKEREKETEGNRFRSERFTNYSRTFTLPSTVEADKIQANYRDGVLGIVVPKGEQAKSRRIEIAEGHPQKTFKIGEEKAKEKDKAA